MSHYRILSIDGGGLRGIMVCVILERLEEACPGFLSKIDLFAGTSTGSILALGMALGKQPDRARALYEEIGHQVFTPSWWRRFRSLGFALGARYSNEVLRQALTKEFGDCTLGQFSKKVLISTFHLDRNPIEAHRLRTWKPKFFNNFQSTDLGERVVDVILRSGSAPTYFPCYQGYIDGGIAANNPSMAALAQALDRETGGQLLDNVVLLSLGTGQFPQYLAAGDGNWGWLQWARPMLSMMMEGSVSVAHYQCSRLLGDCYHRLNPVLPRPIAADDIVALDQLKRIGQEVDLAATIEWLNRYF